MAIDASDAVDAARYRILREQNWHDGSLFVVRPEGRLRLPLGLDCPSMQRLDYFVDELLAETKKNEPK